MHHRYVIVGGGMTAHAAVRGIRAVDPRGSIRLVHREPHGPYQRPPLSKGLWHGLPEASVFYELGDASVQTVQAEATRLDPARRSLELADGRCLGYERLLLATGARPRRLPVANDEGIVYFRTWDDYRRVRAHAARGHGRTVLIGGGFIGLELASSLSEHGQDVTLITRDEKLGLSRLPTMVCEHLEAQAALLGIEVVRGDEVIEHAWDGRTHRVGTRRGVGLEADLVVAGIGVEPETQLARGAGLHVEDGIRVDAQLRTSAPDVFAAGDCACSPVGGFGALRQENEQNANVGGLLAGRAMAGAEVRYDDVPFVYSEFLDGSLEVVGVLEKGATPVPVAGSQGEEGVWCYVRDGRVRGVLFWNVELQERAAEELIASARVDDLLAFQPSLPLRAS